MIFDISIEEAAEMSKLTLGYSYAFQALGYSYWEHKPVKDMQDKAQQMKGELFLRYNREVLDPLFAPYLR